MKAHRRISMESRVSSLLMFCSGCLINNSIEIFSITFIGGLVFAYFTKRMARFSKTCLLFIVFFLFLLIFKYIQAIDLSQDWKPFVAGPLSQAIRLFFITFSIQVLLADFSLSDVGDFTKYGIKMDMLIYWVSANVLVKDVARQVERVYSARYVRGRYSRSFFDRALMLPGLLRPVFIGMLISSGERSESWFQKDIVSLLSNATRGGTSSDKPLSLLTVLLFGGWLVFVLYYNWIGF